MADLQKSTRLGDLLLEQGIIARDQLNQAIALQQSRRLRELQNSELTGDKKELGEILIELGFIDRRQLQFSLGWQRRLRKTTAVMVFVAPLLTAACGGGGGSEPTPSAAHSSRAVVATSSSALSSSSPSMQSSSSSSRVSAELDGPVQLYWSMPTQRENGTLLDATEIGGYELRYKLRTDSEYTYVQLANGYLDAYYFEYLKGDYVFEIATYDVDGRYSDFVIIDPS